MLPRVRALVPHLVVAGLLPLFAYPLVRPHVRSDAVALLVVALLPLADVLVERARTRRLEPIGLIALTGIVVSVLVAAFLHGDATVLKLRESVVSGTFGIACLASLLARRPLLFYVGRGISSGGDPARRASFDRLLLLPTVPRRFRIATLVWGVALVGEVVVRCVLAITVPTETFLVATQLLNWSVYAALLWWTFRYVGSGERAVDAIVEVSPPDAEEKLARPALPT